MFTHVSRYLPAALALALAATAHFSIGADHVEVDVYLETEDNVAEIAFGPDGTIYYAGLNTGDVYAVHPGGDGPGEVIAHVEAEAGGNGGFLGLALDPDFDTTGTFYVYYTTRVGEDKINRVSRIVDGEEEVLLDGIGWGVLHDGGKLTFLPDGTLLVTTGENDEHAPAQDPEDPRGKVLRIHPDGSVPDDNPTPGSVVYASGIRNAFGLAVDPETGNAWFSDNGPDRWDEVNRLEAGGNYGWPECLGPCGGPEYEDPVIAWEEVFGPTGLAYLPVDGNLYLGDFVYGKIRRIDLAADPASWDTLHEFPGERILSVVTGPDGRSLYVGTYTQIHRISWEGSTLPGSGPDAGGPDAANGSGDNGSTEFGGGGKGPDESGAPTPIPSSLVLLGLAASAVVLRSARKE